MSTALTGADKFDFRTKVVTTGNQNAVPDDLRSGSTLFPTLDQSWADGTGSGQAQKHYHDKLTIAGAATTTLDLTSVGSASISFSKVRRVLLRLRSPTAGVKVVVGNAASNRFSPWLSDTTTTEDVADLLYRRSSVDGWTVDGTHKNLMIVNPGVASVSLDVSILGS